MSGVEPARPVLTTARLALRRLTEADADFIQRLLNEPDYLRYIGDRGVRTPAAARAYLRAGPLASYQQQGFGLYLVTARAEGHALGICGLIKRPELDDVDLGFAFLAEHRSQGYAYEAAAAVLAYAQTELGLRRIVAIVDPANTRSVRLLGKLGLGFERTLVWPGDGALLSVYALSA